MIIKIDRDVANKNRWLFSKIFFVFSFFLYITIFFSKTTKFINKRCGSKKTRKTDEKLVKTVDKMVKICSKKWSNFEKSKNATEQKRAFPYKSPNTPNSSLEFIQYSIKQVKTTLTRGFEYTKPPKYILRGNKVN